MIKNSTNLRVKYNRVSTLAQTGNRFQDDKDIYDLVLLDCVSGKVAFAERPEAKKLIKLLNEKRVAEIVVEELSRLGRNTADVITTLDWLASIEVNVVIRNLGIQSRPNDKTNPVFKLLSNVLSSVYEMELENIKERTLVGRKVYVQNGGKLGRPSGSNETNKSFLEKESSKKIIKELRNNLSVRKISKIADVSVSTVMKVKSLLATGS